MAVSKLIPSFNAGELSPYMDARAALDKYQSGCQTLKNFITLPYGAVIRRPGTEFLAAAKYASKQCRLVGFNFSATTNFVLEMGEGYIRFFSNGLQVETSPGTVLEILTPYLESELREVQYVQVNDIMYFTHPKYTPRKLSRLSDTSWTFTEIPWIWPVFLDENDTETTITPSAVTGTNITLTASADIFLPNHVDAYWMIAHRREEAFIEQTLGAGAGTSSILYVLGDWELTTYGNWDGTLKIQRRQSVTGSWETIRTYKNKSQGERNVATTGNEDKICALRLSWNGGGAGAASPNARLEAGDNRLYGVVKIKNYTSATVVTADVVTDLSDTIATKIWAEGAFSERQGYPRTVCLHDQRIVYGGTRRKPLTLWGSIVDDFENFRYDVNDDSAFFFTLAANESNPCNWLISQSGALLIGTAGDEWTLAGADKAQVLGPVNVQARRQSAYGSKYLQAKIVNEVALFMQRQGRKVRELTYSFEKDGWVAPDLNILANHITEGEIVETAFQQQPDAIFWCITGAGKLIGMTYERDQNVVGWHRHETQGTFESVATIYGGSGADEVWFSVLRTVAGQDVRYIERFNVDFRAEFEAGNADAWWYLDCAKKTSSTSPDSTISGMSHLEGLGVGVYADNAVQPDSVVEAGEVTLQLAASEVLLGLPFESLLQPMKIDIPLQDGAAQGRKGRVHKVVARLYKSLGGEYSTDGAEFDTFYFREPGDAMDSAPPDFTGDVEVYTGANYRDAADIIIRQNKPLPMCVIALVARLDFYGE
jgi:hypothetical protein